MFTFLKNKRSSLSFFGSEPKIKPFKCVRAMASTVQLLSHDRRGGTLSPLPLPLPLKSPLP